MPLVRHRCPQCIQYRLGFSGINNEGFLRGMKQPYVVVAESGNRRYSQSRHCITHYVRSFSEANCCQMKLTRPHDEFSPEAGLARWYRHRPLGQRLLRQLTAQLSQELEQIFGYHTVAVGPEIGLPFDKMSKTQRVFRLCTNEPFLAASESVEATAEAMPFATDSVDALILCHTLDATPVPHQVLRECQRVLVPNGHLIIVSFNALSLWGGVNWLWRFLPGKRRRVAGQGVVSCVTGYRCWDLLALILVFWRLSLRGGREELPVSWIGLISG